MPTSIAFPYHDPDLMMFPHLQACLPDLKALFSRAYIGLPLQTQQHTSLVDWLTKDDFFTVFPINREMQIGERFAHVYLNAARAANPDEIIHLAYIDRLAFALEGSYRDQFIMDVKNIGSSDVPLIFQRSAKAWETHPQNYYEIESFVTTIGKILFGKSLDYAWCHLVIRAAELAEILPRVRNPDLSMVAEMVLQLQPDIKTKEVDWLAWEDPFILRRDPDKLKHERENSPEETQKRLAYAVPMVETMTQYALAQNK
jgi:hypothetical protein